MKFVDPKNDVAFKKIFGSEHKPDTSTGLSTRILISFLNAVLDLTGDREIQTVQILNPYQTPRIAELKYTILDVKATDRRGVTFIVEMQVENMEALKKRFTYYIAKAYVSQIERGEDYPKLNQVIFIGVLDFTLFEGEDYLTRHLILNTSTHEQELKDLEFNPSTGSGHCFIELPKFTKSEAELETDLEKWVYFIKHAGDLEVIPESADFEAIQTAYEEAKRFNWSKEDLEVYEYRGIKIQDARGAVQLATKKGIKKGEHRKAAEIARNLLQLGLDVAQIAQATGLSSTEIADLAEGSVT